MTTPQAEPFQSVAQLFRSRLKEDADRPAAMHKQGGAWKNISWGELAARGEAIAWGLLALGARRGQMIGLIGATRIEWTMCDLGVTHTGATAVPIYHSNTAEEIRFILDNAGTVLVFVENAVQLKKLQEVKAKLPKVARVILMEGEAPSNDGWALSLAALEKVGVDHKNATPDALEKALSEQRSDDLHTLLYTSGTTGEPKGVMITNDNMIFAAECSVNTGLLTREQRHLLFLPFAHSFAQIIKCGWFGSGLTQIFAESVDKIVDNAQQTGPTSLSAVPRVYEKVFSTAVAGALGKKGLAGFLSRMAMREFDSYAKARDAGTGYSSLGFSLAKKLVFPKIHAALRDRLGGKMLQLVSGGAPLARKIGYFFDLLGFHMLEGYGLTETIALTSINLPGKIKLGTVGKAFAGVELKIAADGEILERGRNVMRGYYNKPEATAEAIDAEGWFHTGDIGELDADGFLKITDRKKDLIKTSGGKYIAPQAIEGALKTGSELISQVVVIGDGHKYVSVLLTVVDDAAKKLAQAGGEASGSYAESAKSKAVHAKVKQTIDALNGTLASYETIKKFTILDKDFSQESGELTPTLKVKRKACTAKFKAQIDAMYEGE
jgi:long-chain acyl-CoA synthetase